MSNRPYSAPRPRQHNAHVAAFYARRVLARRAAAEASPPPIRYTSGGRGLGRFGR